jgi:hypothetical protein
MKEGLDDKWQNPLPMERLLYVGIAIIQLPYGLKMSIIML